MPWGAVAGAAIGLVGDQMKSDKNGGAGTTSKEPWAPATPWLLQNVAQGQGLQQQYTDRPFSAKQNAAYDNIYAQNDYTRGLVPSLLNQLQGQQVGFDKSNPTAKQKAWDWNLLSDSNALNQRSVANAKEPEPAKKAAGDFVNYDINANPLGKYYGSFIDPTSAHLLSDGGEAMRQQFLGNQGGAGFGSFKYGMAVPQKGTQAYRDYQEYLNYGGADPFGLYGGGAAAAGPYGNLGGSAGAASAAGAPGTSADGSY